MKFTSQVNVEITHQSINPPGFEYEMRRSKSKVNYEMEVEFKAWGINGISFFLPNQVLSLEVELMPLAGEDYECYTFEVQVESSTIEEPESFKGAIAPQELELTLSKITRSGPYTFQATATAILKF